MATDVAHPARPSPRRGGGGVLHIPSLDGLRAVSFMIVFLAHAGASAIPGGFGVTVFFFLSGFLITTLMRMEQEKTGTVNLRHFYLRRVLRILPPFYLILVFAATLSLLHIVPGTLRGEVLLAQASHIANYWFIWYGGDGAPAGTVPYWSLAVEEHFYLLFPLLYLVLSRRLPRSAQASAIWAVCLIIAIWRCVLVFGLNAIDDRTYMGSDTRFDSIFFGCALAIGANPMLDPPRVKEWIWKWLLLPAALVVLFITFEYRAPWFRETIRYSLQGIALTPVFITAVRFPRWLPYRFVNLRLVAFVGVLSYVLYLVHQVILFALGYQLPSLHVVPRSLLALMLSLVIAVAIHHFVEKPCARMRRRLTEVPTSGEDGAEPRRSYADGRAQM